MREQLTREFCLHEIMKNNFHGMRIGLSTINIMYDGLVEVTDWHGNMIIFGSLSKAIDAFILINL